MAPLLRAALYGALFVALLALAAGQLLAGFGAATPRILGILQVVGIAATLSGSALALWCVFLFARFGRGTPIPIDPPRQLVVDGPYKVVRNPMAVGVAIALSGVAAYYESVAFLVAVGLFMVGIHAMIVLYEEPTLRRTFGDEYVAYCNSVRRWLPGGRGLSTQHPPDGTNVSV